MKQLSCIVSEYWPGQDLDGWTGWMDGGHNDNNPLIRIWQSENLIWDCSDSLLCVGR